MDSHVVSRSRARRYIILISLVALLLLVLLLWFWPTQRAVPYDYIGVKAESLGFEPERIASFVRQKVQIDGYRGYLRGPVGTLWAGAGSPLDRAALLVALLVASEKEARIASDGSRWWVQLRDGPGWRDMLLEGDNGAANWTGREPPESEHHLLDVSVEVGGKTGDSKQHAVYRTADLVHHPLVLQFGPSGQYRLGTLGSEGAFLEGACGRSDDETLLLRFTYRRPGDAEAVHFRREIYTGRYEDYRSLNDPRNKHVIVVAPGRIQEWAADKEMELARTEGGQVDSGVGACYALALAHIGRSDRALVDLRSHFEVTAYYAEPRVIIASGCYLGQKDKHAMPALDLRRNRIHSEGAQDACASFGVTRAALEGQIEGVVLKKAYGGPVFAAIDVFREHIQRRRSSSQGRVRMYLNLMQRLLTDTRPGARMTIALDTDRKVVLARGEGKDLSVVSISDDLRNRMKDTQVRWEMLEAKAIRQDAFAQAAMELEMLLGPVGGADLDYTPQVDLQESVSQLVAPNVRMFRWWTPKDEKKAKLTLEYQFIETKKNGDVVYDSVDHWDEIAGKPIRSSRHFSIPAKTVEQSRVISRWYSRSRYAQGDSFLMFSRQMLRELKQQGHTVVRYRDRYNKLSDPLKLYLCGRREADVLVNNKPRKLAVLDVGGGYLKDNLPKQDFKDVKKIPEQTCPYKSAMNRWEVLDNPVSPISGVKGLRFQTVLPGRVVSSRTGLGVPDAKVSVGRTSASGTTWADGRFLLPVMKEPLGRFEVTVKAAGYAPFSAEMDLSAIDAFPLHITLTPNHEGGRLVWIDHKTLGKLAQIDTPRVRDLVRAAIQDDPRLVALVPPQRVHYGMGSTHAWLLFDRDRFHFTAVTEDGLHGTAGDVWQWMHDKPAGMMIKEYSTMDPPVELDRDQGPTKMHEGAINFFAGYVASWYAYSAGKMDMLSKMLEGQEFDDVGHAHAMKFALDFLESMQDGVNSYPAQYFGADGMVYNAGFRAGLQFFERNPVYRGE